MTATATTAVGENSGGLPYRLIATDLDGTLLRSDESVSPRTREALGMLLTGSRGRDARYDQFIDELLVDLGDLTDGEARARYLTQKIALAVQAAILLGHGPDTSAQAFLASRISRGAPAAFGTLHSGVDSGAMIERILRL